MTLQVKLAGFPVYAFRYIEGQQLRAVRKPEEAVLLALAEEFSTYTGWTVISTRSCGLLGFPRLSKSDSRLSFGGSHGNS